jgi:hypothetical protein
MSPARVHLIAQQEAKEAKLRPGEGLSWQAIR